MEEYCVQARIGGENLKDITRRRITFEDAPNILSQTIKHDRWAANS